ncbi:MAG: L-aspartate oxidase [Desulfovibrionaceae bacterium]|nr:L-aspartate oxidase [Desulfovibrionaceae bacterium]MBF0515093.1 L-aspartate oxidase [Desulfovibrionaceae bacterium]
MTCTRMHTQALVIGSGLAGCSAALAMAEKGLAVTLLTSGGELTGGNSPLAQGGIVYTGSGDSPRLLEKDILACGAGYNYLRAVRHIAKNGPASVRELLIGKAGVPFDAAAGGGLHLTKEGGHSVSRIIHAADQTGAAIMNAMAGLVRANANITVLTRRTAVDLLTSHHQAKLLEFKYQLANQCAGAYVFNDHERTVETVLADFTVLATGGVGQIFLHTTNSRPSIGSALAMAYRAGVKSLNEEFIQFHPTALFLREQRRFLISEAMRGEGARLVNSRGEAFMARHDPRLDLAPRDVVTRAILDEMLQTGEDCVYLDATNVARVRERFPAIAAKCLEIGVDIGVKPIPVVPAAHYFCGGVLVDERGRTTLERLYAVGECSCTGLHGANRMASTSLLECLVWGQGAGQDIARRVGAGRAAHGRRLKDSIPDWVAPGRDNNEDQALIAQDWATIRNTMWNYVGIHRTSSRLKRAFEDLRDQNRHLHDFYRETPLSKPIVDLFHGCQAAYLITLAAMRNKQSIGCHYRID